MKILLRMWCDEIKSYPLVGDFHWLVLLLVIVVPSVILGIGDLYRGFIVFCFLLGTWAVIYLGLVVEAIWKTYKRRHLKDEYLAYKIKNALKNAAFKDWLEAWDSLTDEEKRKTLTEQEAIS